MDEEKDFSLEKAPKLQAFNGKVLFLHFTKILHAWHSNEKNALLQMQNSIWYCLQKI